MTYRLVPATQDNRKWLEELRRLVYRDLFVATWGKWDEARHLRHFAESWERGEICIIEVGADQVGMVQLFDTADSLEVGEIQIHPSHQRRGIATRVLQDTITRAHADDKTVSLSTGLQNLGAIALYRRLGFRSSGQSETHYHMTFEPPTKL